jgi:hypothetical protein
VRILYLVYASAVVHAELQRAEVPHVVRLGLLRQHGAAVPDVHDVDVGALDERHQHARPHHRQLRALGGARLRVRHVPGLRRLQRARQRVQHIVVPPPLLLRRQRLVSVLVISEDGLAGELAAHGGVEVPDEVVGGVGAVEAVVDADEHPAVLLRQHDVHPVLPGLPARPLHPRRRAAGARRRVVLADNAAAAVCEEFPRAVVVAVPPPGRRARAAAQHRREGAAEAAEDRAPPGRRLALTPVPHRREVHEDLLVGARAAPAVPRHGHAGDGCRGGRRRAAVQRPGVLPRLERPEGEGVGAVERRRAGQGHLVVVENGDSARGAHRGLVRRQQDAVEADPLGEALAAVEAENVPDAARVIAADDPVVVHDAVIDGVVAVPRSEARRGHPRHAVAHGGWRRGRGGEDRQGGEGGVSTTDLDAQRGQEMGGSGRR